MFSFKSNQLGCLGSTILSVVLIVAMRSYSNTGTHKMLATIGDVMAIAKKVWPDAVVVNVALAPTNSRTQKMYRVTALGQHDSNLRHLDSPNLNKMKLLLEQQLTAEACNE